MSYGGGYPEPEVDNEVIDEVDNENDVMEASERDNWIWSVQRDSRPAQNIPALAWRGKRSVDSDRWHECSCGGCRADHLWTGGEIRGLKTVTRRVASGKSRSWGVFQGEAGNGVEWINY